MQLIVILRVMGLLLMTFSTTLLPPLFVSAFYLDGAHFAFATPLFITLILGILLWLPVRNKRRDIRVRDGFVIVTLFWVLLALSGSLPLSLAHHPHLTFTDAFFESISGLTTTGATVLTGIDELPESIRYYRQQLQWLGGMGIVVLALAVMPMLGVGGMQLYRAETPGPLKDTKLMPRISETAKALWYIYLGLTVACAIAYWVAGMTVFDAIGHSFSTIAIGGFSTHDQSMGYFNDPTVSAVAIVFMVLAGVNFALHFGAWRHRSIRPYFLDAEVRAYLTILLVVVLITTATLLVMRTFDGWQDTLHHAVFQAVSIATTTGFTTTGFANWPVYLPVLLVTAAFIGGCAGSTAGGMKVIRALLLYKQGVREIFRLVHPAAIYPVKIGGRPTDDAVLNAVWGFFSLYVVSFAILSLIMMGTGIDLITAFSAVAATMTNLGPGLGDVANNYASLTATGKWVLCFAMLLGRLELFTLLVLFTRTFWRN
ncbi:MAG: potassium transporter [Acidithiobacillales bacterium SG8_45]|jgi:trk system potassium uptake protein TrkH|nr:MAG: potassium transporter [Acidithiobacillales bacterium SG8_45]